MSTALIEVISIMIIATCNGVVMGLNYGLPIGFLTFVSLIGLYRLR